MIATPYSPLCHAGGTNNNYLTDTCNSRAGRQQSVLRREDRDHPHLQPRPNTIRNRGQLQRPEGSIRPLGAGITS